LHRPFGNKPDSNEKPEVKGVAPGADLEWIAGLPIIVHRPLLFLNNFVIAATFIVGKYFI